MPQGYLTTNREGAVRLAMAHTYAARLFNDAAAKKDPDIMKILSDAIKVPVPLIEKRGAALDMVRSERHARYRIRPVRRPISGRDTMGLVSGKVPKDKLFDLSAAEEAARRLQSANPFG